nr:probable ATP-dependent RNA helicase DDX23 [Arachis hypogaea]
MDSERRTTPDSDLSDDYRHRHRRRSPSYDSYDRSRDRSRDRHRPESSECRSSKRVTPNEAHPNGNALPKNFGRQNGGLFHNRDRRNGDWRRRFDSESDEELKGLPFEGYRRLKRKSSGSKRSRRKSNSDNESDESEESESNYSSDGSSWRKKKHSLLSNVSRRERSKKSELESEGSDSEEEKHSADAKNKATVEKHHRRQPLEETNRILAEIRSDSDLDDNDTPFSPNTTAAFSLGSNFSDWDQQRQQWLQQNSEYSNFICGGKSRCSVEEEDEVEKVRMKEEWLECMRVRRVSLIGSEVVGREKRMALSEEERG